MSYLPIWILFKENTINLKNFNNLDKNILLWNEIMSATAPKSNSSSPKPPVENGKSKTASPVQKSANSRNQSPKSRNSVNKTPVSRGASPKSRLSKKEDSKIEDLQPDKENEQNEENEENENLENEEAQEHASPEIIEEPKVIEEPLVNLKSF